MPKEVQIDYVTLTNTLGSPVDLVRNFPGIIFAVLGTQMFKPWSTRCQSKINQTFIVPKSQSWDKIILAQTLPHKIIEVQGFPFH